MFFSWQRRHPSPLLATPPEVVSHHLESSPGQENSPHDVSGPVGRSGAPALAPDTRVPADLRSYIRNFGWPADDGRYTYRVTTPEAAPLVNDLYNKVFGQDRPVSHYLWKAWGSPAGEPFSAHAVSRETGKAVATMTGIRRRFSVAGRRADAIMVCETCSDADERRGGHAYRKAFKGGASRATDTAEVWWAYGGQSTDEAIAIR